MKEGPIYSILAGSKRDFLLFWTILLPKIRVIFCLKCQNSCKDNPLSIYIHIISLIGEIFLFKNKMCFRVGGEGGFSTRCTGGLELNTWSENSCRNFFLKLIRKKIKPSKKVARKNSERLKTSFCVSLVCSFHVQNEVKHLHLVVISSWERKAPSIFAEVTKLKLLLFPSKHDTFDDYVKMKMQKFLVNNDLTFSNRSVI